MNKKSTSQSAFALRLLVASVFCAASVVITLLGFGEFSVQAQQRQQVIMQSTNPLVPVGFDCSRVRELGIDKQENLRAGAIMIACGEAQGGTPSVSSALFEAIKNALAPLAYGATDVDLVTGTETSPNVTQSETFTASNPDNPNQIVVAYTIHAAAMSAPSTSREHRFPPMAATPLPVSPTPVAKAPSPTPSAILLFCTIDQRAPGSLFGWTGAAEVRVSADTSPPRRGARIAGFIIAFTITTKTT